MSRMSANASPGRLILDYHEDGNHEHAAVRGEGSIGASGWAHWLNEEDGSWTSWPPHAVICIEWDT